MPKMFEVCMEMEQDREARRAKAAKFEQLARDVTRGLGIPEEVWADRDWHAFIKGVLLARARLQKDSEDLHTVARIFGGSAR